MSVGNQRRVSHIAGNMMTLAKWCHQPQQGSPTCHSSYTSPPPPLLFSNLWTSPPSSTNDLASFFIDKNKNHHHKKLIPLLPTRSSHLSRFVLKVEEESFSCLRPTLAPTSCFLPHPDLDPSLMSSLCGIFNFLCISDPSL